MQIRRQDCARNCPRWTRSMNRNCRHAAQLMRDQQYQSASGSRRCVRTEGNNAGRHVYSNATSLAPLPNYGASGVNLRFAWISDAANSVPASRPIRANMAPSHEQEPHPPSSVNRRHVDSA